MKKLIAAVGVTVLLVGMTACGQGERNAEAEAREIVDSEQISENAVLENSALKNDVFYDGSEENSATVISPNATVSGSSESAHKVENELDGGSSDSEGQTPDDGFHSPEQTTAASQPPHAHNYIATIVASTCTEGGYTEHTCACNENYRDTYTTALGHNFTGEVIPPTTTSQGYTHHTCTRCGYSYEDSYTDALPSRWDTEEAVADLCRRANAYIEAVGCILDPTAGSWAAPRYTGVKGVDMETCYQAVLAEIETYRAEGKTHLYVYYFPYADAFQIYVAYNLIIS